MIGRGSDTQTESGEGAWIFPSKVAWLNLIAESFTWPFKGRWWPAWALGMLAVVLGPIGVVPLLGYAIAATRAAENDPAKGPPRWEHFGRLMSDGFWTALVILLIGLPFAWVLRVYLTAGDLAVAPLQEHHFTWIQSGTFNVGWDYMADKLTMIMLLVVTGIGSLIHIYATGYMAHE